jgi:hypothetical protein
LVLNLVCLRERNWILHGFQILFQCAILSPTFRVRDFAIQDCQLYPITLSWQGGGLDEDRYVLDI